MSTALKDATVAPLIRAALREDRARQDLTSRAVLPANLRIRARVIANAPGVLAGVQPAALVFTALDPSLRCRLHRRSGAALKRGSAILTVEGRARSIFAAERTALNLLGHLCGIATLTRAYVDRVRGTRARILDTRKTLPGLRALEKEAVRAGGGASHRSDLAEAILIKTNHLRAASCVVRRASAINARELLRTARRKTKGKFLEVEVANLKEFAAALETRPNAILLDNWRLSDIRRAVRLRATRHASRTTPLLEVSGGVTLANVRAIARAGVDRISIGRLTHSAPALDVSLKVL
jgi:nicotinate-nucleotide pyrophosphorylase (carboxylating)